MSFRETTVGIALLRMAGAPFELVSYLAFLGLMRTARKYDVDGFELVIASPVPDDLSEVALTSTRVAIETLREVDPLTLRLMRTAMNRIVVVPGMCCEFINNSRVCLLGADRIAGMDGQSLAVFLVHEYTHARIYRRGILRQAGAHLQRVERLCKKREIRYTQRMLKKGWRVDALLSLLHEQLESEYSTKRVREERLKDWARQDAPRWVVAGRKVADWIQGD